MSAIDLMAQDCGLAVNDVAGLEYRAKSRAGWPGEVCFHLADGRLEYARFERSDGYQGLCNAASLQGLF